MTIATEDQEQQALFEWARMTGRPELKLLYSIPNGGYRHPATAKKLRLTGVKPGVPDLCLPVARGGFNGLYIELKRVKGGSLSALQRQWLDALEKQGYKAVCCKGWEEAAEVIRGYLQ